MIPRIIHYCWFGHNPKPKLAEKCIKSWKKYCPDYEIIEWNEDNFDISSCPLYVRQAYEAKKWAFVTDYVRLQVVYERGGIYMDTDVELKKSLDPLLSYQAYFGFEDGLYIATGLGFGAIKGASILMEMMEDYKDIPFLLPDGSYDTTPCPKRNTAVLLKHGLHQNGKMQVHENCAFLPPSWLCPIDCYSGMKCITKDTISIHHFSASWLSEQDRQFNRAKRAKLRRWRIKDYIVHIPNRIGMKLLGMNRYEKLKELLKK